MNEFTIDGNLIKTFFDNISNTLNIQLYNKSSILNYHTIINLDNFNNSNNIEQNKNLIYDHLLENTLEDNEGNQILKSIKFKPNIGNIELLFINKYKESNKRSRTTDISFFSNKIVFGGTSRCGRCSSCSRGSTSRGRGGRGITCNHGSTCNNESNSTSITSITSTTSNTSNTSNTSTSENINKQLLISTDKNISLFSSFSNIESNNIDKYIKVDCILKIFLYENLDNNFNKKIYDNNIIQLKNNIKEYISAINTIYNIPKSEILNLVKDVTDIN
jgi:hypothetical protein